MCRIIPARAGFTDRQIRVLSALSDHPRSRGVYPATRPGTKSAMGSSPLARGLRQCFQHGPGQRWDHPRSRGVYSTSGRRPSSRGGSSPLARGLRGLHIARTAGWRIIPARAGFTGEPVDEVAQVPGSSPLARGLPRQAGAGGDECRIIPARAGFTPPPGGGPRPGGDHPRSRGVYVACTSLGRPDGGSSPLARGLLPGGAQELLQGGIIPARAGFTDRHRHRRGRRQGSSPLARGLPWSG